MSKGTILWIFIILLSIGLFVYFEFPLKDEGIVFKNEKFTLRIPSLIEAQNSLTIDTVDNFFEKISKVDIELQMKTKFSTNNNKDSLKLVYENFLKNQIVKFKSAEIRGLKRIANEVFQMMENKIPKPIPIDIQIVKITQNIYGANVFFTRNKTIFLTEDFFSLNLEQRKQTFAHELSHIFSRYVKDYKEKLYPTIGFENENIDKPKVFHHEIYINEDGFLLNPDGANEDCFFKMNLISKKYKIDSSDFSPVLAFKNDSILNKDYLKNAEFRFVEFNLRKSRFKKSDPFYSEFNVAVRIWSDEIITDYQNYFKQNYGITYTIHPDEIIAELFVQWLLDEKAVNESSGLKSKTFEVFNNCLNQD